MRDFKKKCRRLKFTEGYLPIAVVNILQDFAFFKPVSRVWQLKEFGYHNWFEGIWITIHLKSGLMVRKFDNEDQAKRLAQRLEISVKKKWNPDRKELAHAIEVLRSVKQVSGRTLGVCFEDIYKPTDDIPF